MPIEKPVLLQPVSGDNTIQYSARELRSALLGALFSREGVWDRRAGHLLVTQRGQGANMSVDVAPGRAAIFGDDASDQGAYVVNSTTVLNVTIPAPSQSASRTHRIILRVRDRSENGTWSPNTYDAVLQVQPDTTAAAALPSTSIPLAAVTTPANASSVTNAMITLLRPLATVGTRSEIGPVPTTAGWGPFPGNETSYSVTPDGVVLLSGQIVRTGATFTLGAGATQVVATLPTEIRPSRRGSTMVMLGQGYRFGAAGIRVNGDVVVSFSAAQQIVQNTFWLTLDGLSYRLDA